MKIGYRFHRRLFGPDLVVLQIGEEIPVYAQQSGTGLYLIPAAPPLPGTPPTGYRTRYLDATPADLLDREVIASLYREREG
jgi:hypothetical protein